MTPVILSTDQRRALDRLIEDADDIGKVVEKDRRWKWAATTVRNTLAWLAALIGAGYVVWEFLGKTVKKLSE